MMSHDLININLEVYKYKHSDAPSRSKWLLNDIFYTNVVPRISAVQLYAACEDPSSYS